MSWDPDAHPRGRDGVFVAKGEPVLLDGCFHTDTKGNSIDLTGRRGDVRHVTPDPSAPGQPWVVIRVLNDKRKKDFYVRVKPWNVSRVPDAPLHDKDTRFQAAQQALYDAAPQEFRELAVAEPSSGPSSPVSGESRADLSVIEGIDTSQLPRQGTQVPFEPRMNEVRDRLRPGEQIIYAVRAQSPRGTMGVAVLTSERVMINTKNVMAREQRQIELDDIRDVHVTSGGMFYNVTMSTPGADVEFRILRNRDVAEAFASVTNDLSRRRRNRSQPVVVEHARPRPSPAQFAPPPSARPPLPPPATSAPFAPPSLATSAEGAASRPTYDLRAMSDTALRLHLSFLQAQRMQSGAPAWLAEEFERAVVEFETRDLRPP